MRVVLFTCLLNSNLKFSNSFNKCYVWWTVDVCLCFPCELPLLRPEGLFCCPERKGMRWPRLCPKLTKDGVLSASFAIVLSLDTAVVSSSTSIRVSRSDPQSMIPVPSSGVPACCTSEIPFDRLGVGPVVAFLCALFSDIIDGCFDWWWPLSGNGVRWVRYRWRWRWEACFLIWKWNERGKRCLSTRCWSLAMSVWKRPAQPSTRHSYWIHPRDQVRIKQCTIWLWTTVLCNGSMMFAHIVGGG